MNTAFETVPPQQFLSTRDDSLRADLATAVLTGLAPDGGLWVPEQLVPFTPEAFDHLHSLTLPELGTELAFRLLGEVMPFAELHQLVSEALDFPVPLRHLDQVGADLYSLELFHGPTLAFKDVGARFMARLLAWARRSQDATETQTILVATSGDTGSAVAQAFLGLEGFRVIVLFPKNGVSEAQRKLFTTLGANTRAIRINGTFDDCQRLVKGAFSDQELRQEISLGSANSINIARLLPQAFYYVWARSQLQPGDRLRPLWFSVPSGNFGNLTAGLIAHRLGLPVERFIAATNANDVVPQFLDGGAYRPRPSVATVANAMDVGNPSNWERIQWLWPNQTDLRAFVVGERFSDEQIIACIEAAFERTGVCLDPHAAVGYLAARARLVEDRDAIGIVLGTAHPAKFGEVLPSALEHQARHPVLEQALSSEEQFEELGPDPDAFRELLLSLPDS